MDRPRKTKLEAVKKEIIVGVSKALSTLTVSPSPVRAGGLRRAQDEARRAFSGSLQIMYLASVG